MATGQLHFCSHVYWLSLPQTFLTFFENSVHYTPTLNSWLYHLLQREKRRHALEFCHFIDTKDKTNPIPLPVEVVSVHFFFCQRLIILLSPAFLKALYYKSPTSWRPKVRLNKSLTQSHTPSQYRMTLFISPSPQCQHFSVHIFLCYCLANIFYLCYL